MQTEYAKSKIQKTSHRSILFQTVMCPVIGLNTTKACNLHDNVTERIWSIDFCAKIILMFNVFTR